VTADNTTKTYGQGNPAFTATYSGFVNGDSVSHNDLTGSPSLTTTAINSSPVSSYTITAGKGTLASTNYTFSFVNGNLAVTPAHLTVTADNKSKVYGSANPPLTATISGFVLGQTLGTSNVGGSASCSTTATQSSGVGSSPYPITCTQGSLNATNYDFPAGNFVGGQLTVTPATLTVTADNQQKQYGDPNPSLTATLSGFVAGDSTNSNDVSGSASCTTTAIKTSVVGTYPITCTIGTLSSTNYNFTFAGGTLTVVPRQDPVAYIGQTLFYTSGSSSTSAQVALSASLQDTTGSGADLKNATVTFTDLLSGKVLASNVPVSPVSGSTIPTGTANTIVTLSSGQYGAQDYLIQVSVGGMFQNCQQTGPYGSSCSGSPAVSTSSSQYAAAHPTVTVEIPPTKNTVQAALPSLNTASPYAPAGKYGTATTVSYAVGMQYNNKGTSPQGQIQLILQQGGTTYYIKSNSITSLGFSATTDCGKDVTIYTKASIYSVNASGQQTSVDGNVSLRVDAHDGDKSTGSMCTPSPTYDTIGFTVLSSKDGSLYYSNNWVYNNAVAGWSTVQEPVTGSNGSAVVIN
jgi:hypothetical protein